MRFSLFGSLLVLLLCWTFPAKASSDKDFLAGREAFAKGRTDQLVRIASRVPDQYPLKVYLDYWRLKRQSTSADTLLAFAEAHPDTPLSEHLRQDVARLHGRSENWSAFRNLLGKLNRQDREIQCYDLRSRLSLADPGALRDGLELWRSPQDLPSACDPLFADLTSRGLLTADDRRARLRLALETGNLKLARELIGELPDEPRPDPALLPQAKDKPASLFGIPAATPAHREIQLYALSQWARSDLDRATGLWESRAAEFSEGDARYGWAILATAAAMQHRPEAVAWYGRAGEQLSEYQRVWRIRAMLRAGRWLDVYQGIQALPEHLRDDAAWRYWKARALRALNAEFQANQLFAELSREFSYYGLLAYEELPVRLESGPDDYRPGPDDIQAAETHPGLARALLLRKLGLNHEAATEWDWAVRNMGDRALLAAAEVARRAEWYDRAIATAEKTRETHSFDLRYLTPFRDLAEARAGENGLDPAWVYGLMRQESRFVDYARSRVGAQGLMQIMPATAKWIARQLGLGGKAQAGMHDPETNIRFGTFYLKRLMDSLDGSPVLATAGYNAGPGRARKWQADVPLEGAIYAETIPFTETREYVKKVLANAMHYSRRLGLPGHTLKDRLGMVPAKRRQETSG